MKKLMFAAAAAALCGAVFAEGEITSVNVVGYQQKETPQAKFMIGTVPFETTGGTLELQKLLSGLTPATIEWSEEGEAGEGFKLLAPQLQIWNGKSYDLCFYVTNAYDEKNDKEVPGWCDDFGTYRDGFEFTPGGAYWVKNSPDSNPLMLSGAINDAEQVSYACSTGWSLAGNAYPVAITLNGKDQMKSDDLVPVAIEWTEEGEATDSFKTTATQLQVWNGKSYDLCYYVTNAYDEANDLEVPGWCDDFGTYRAGYEIPSGNGFWIHGVSGAFTFDFINPIK